MEIKDYDIRYSGLIKQNNDTLNKKQKTCRGVEVCNNNLAYGNRERIFVNTTLGCKAKCCYCYLPNLDLGEEIQYFSAKEVIKQVMGLDYFVKGKKGTIISIGCYSECWDERNKKETIYLIKYFAQFGNYIQLASKKEILLEELAMINNMLQHEKQLGIYISIPCISVSEKLEPGTDLVKKRIRPLEYKDQFRGIYFVLYIKPVLQDVTIKDKQRYYELIKKYKINTVVGSLLQYDDENKTEKELVGEERLKEVDCIDNRLLIDELKRVGGVYKHSTEIINEIRTKGGK